MKKLAALMLVVVFSLTAIFGATLTVGAKNFSEQYVLGNLASLLLEENGFNVVERFGLSSLVARQGLTTGQIDLYPDYTGTAWVTYLGQEELITDPDELLEKVRELDAENGIVWLDRINANNTYALAIRQEDYEKYGFETLSDLVAYWNEHPKEFVVGVGYEFYERPDGFFAFAEHYGLDIPDSQVSTMQLGLTYEAIANNKIDIAMVFATDPKILRYNLHVLEDDQNFWPYYHISYAVRKDTLDEYPEIEEILRPLTLYLNQDILIRLNYRVDVEGVEPEVVARDYLEGLGLID
ncbi:glycine/betaine ABC transporter substrate-binding protein [Petrotoga sibirica DSM 13575]|uniref:Osmoprotectant transport system substrate-binding protein n=2 Tax=Petrotoga sibirica TaxID=156202 RepID=A0A4R8ET32_9BACT|nr:glycine/betaine ABC transporter substrate-binding protein [Petrotoga sibirica DSM 13575]POZ90757.1 glycine/betaine ABC transporter substrate-binding protein [Petrotoga sp. SL27]TDX13307.1 osmoprotectant transport system substrate-binding protein [Petrotoga sibirica]